MAHSPGHWARGNHSSQTTPHPKNASLGLIAQFLNAAGWVRLLVASQVPIKLTCMRNSVDVPEAYPLLMLQGTELPGTAQNGDTQQMLRPTQAGMHHDRGTAATKLIVLALRELHCAQIVCGLARPLSKSHLDPATALCTDFAGNRGW
ncbi:uncharacterized protein FMAN_05860 [Fusarium mangiferae]|uniref:Uncharacterized protein n=1 Tax=Fusarium mangiferae TaxID=192010 RepID=A0A1L7SMM9_FUSMA|nr:uncharacterized protein FMAN_05860 [Fusarium mangiferae]CVK86910.1 uncharacterized protein FMAN_05860 [Fusarium mangiferae]